MTGLRVIIIMILIITITGITTGTGIISTTDITGTVTVIGIIHLHREAVLQETVIVIKPLADALCRSQGLSVRLHRLLSRLQLPRGKPVIPQEMPLRLVHHPRHRLLPVKRSRIQHQNLLQMAVLHHLIHPMKLKNKVRAAAGAANQNGKIMKKLLFIIILFSTNILFGQYSEDDALRPFNGFSGHLPQSAAIGGAGVAAGQVLPELSLNPANIAMTKFRILRGTYGSGEFTSGSKHLPQNRISHFSYAHAIPVFRGYLSWGTGITQDLEYAMKYETSSYSQRIEGSSYMFHLAGATEFAKDLFIGADFQIPMGDFKLTATDHDLNTLLLVEPSFIGLSGKIGLIHTLTPYLNIGINAQLPKTLWVTEDNTEVFGDTLTVEYQPFEYTLTRPLELQVGAALLLKWFDLFYQADLINWSGLNWDSEDNELFDQNINEGIEENFDRTLTHRAGVAIHPPFLPVNLYGGYQFRPNQHKNEDPVTVTSLGFSWLFRQSVNISTSWQSWSWEYENQDESWKQLLVGMEFIF